jgi:hypothetical protein
MRVEIAMEGGLAHFPGLARPVVIDVERLPDADRVELQQLLGAARFFEQPREVGAPRRGVPDARSYTITVEDGERRHTVRVSEPVADSHLSKLVGLLRSKAREARKGPP